MSHCAISCPETSGKHACIHFDGKPGVRFPQRVPPLGETHPPACSTAAGPKLPASDLQLGNTWGPPPPTIPHLLNSIAASSQEVSILSKLSHSNVVRFIGACTIRPNLCIVCELMPGGSVFDLLRRVRKGVMPLFCVWGG